MVILPHDGTWFHPKTKDENMKKNMKTLSGYDLKNGMVVFLQGHPMTISDVRLDGDKVCFAGTPYGETVYNGGDYRLSVKVSYSVKI